MAEDTPWNERNYIDVWMDIEKLAREACNAAPMDGEMLDGDQQRLQALSTELEHVLHGG